MDMTFSLRSRLRDQRRDQADLLGSLLAQAAARQAMTPTARAQHGMDEPVSEKNVQTNAVGCFAPDAMGGRENRTNAAFNPGVADAMQTGCQSL